MTDPADLLGDLLSDAAFPASRDALVRHAEGREGADEQVLHTLLVLPEGTYPDLDAVLAETRADPDRAARAPGPTSGAPDIVADDD